MTEPEQVRSIYETYPRHVGCGAALKAIEKAAVRLVKAKLFPDDHAARRFLWKKAREYALSPAGQKPPQGSNDYRPHPATFFNQDRFFDDPQEWLKPNGVSGNGKASHDGRPFGSTKADRTAESLYSLLHAGSETNHGSTGGNRCVPGSRSVSDLFASDDTPVIEGRP